MIYSFTSCTICHDLHLPAPRVLHFSAFINLSRMRIARPCRIIRDFGTHTTPRVLHFSALVIAVIKLLSLCLSVVYNNDHTFSDAFAARARRDKTVREPISNNTKEVAILKSHFQSSLTLFYPQHMSK